MGTVPGRCPVCGDSGGFHNSQVHLSERFRTFQERDGAFFEVDEPVAEVEAAFDRGHRFLTGRGWVDVDQKH